MISSHSKKKKKIDLKPGLCNNLEGAKWEGYSRGREHRYTYGWFVLTFGRNQHNKAIILQLKLKKFNFKNSLWCTQYSQLHVLFLKALKITFKAPENLDLPFMVIFRLSIYSCQPVIWEVGAWSRSSYYYFQKCPSLNNRWCGCSKHRIIDKNTNWMKVLSWKPITVI